ncbi:hypothetical protein AMTR_s00001p00125510, partial [Amborella trichopoda]
DLEDYFAGDVEPFRIQTLVLKNFIYLAYFHFPPDLCIRTLRLNPNYVIYASLLVLILGVNVSHSSDPYGCKQCIETRPLRLVLTWVAWTRLTAGSQNGGPRPRKARPGPFRHLPGLVRLGRASLSWPNS